MKTRTITRTKGSTLMLTGLLMVVICWDIEAQVHDSRPYSPIVWLSKPPADCPFEQSEEIVGITFTGRHQEYTDADTWFPSWASDGNLYSPWTDGIIDKTWPDGSPGRISGISGGGDSARTGHAKIVGDDPLNLKVIPLGTFPGAAKPYHSRYPSGSLIYDNIWYYGTHVEGPQGTVIKDGHPYDLPWLGPLIGFRISKDFGKTWIDTPHTPLDPLFGESGLDENGQPNGAPIKIGEPFFVDFGKNMEHSPDGKAYLVAHGAVDPDPRPRFANCSWITGDLVYMLRIVPSPENINNANKYEFFAGHDDQGKPIWTHDFSKIKPLIDWNNKVGVATMTYNPYLKKYLFCITNGRKTTGPFDTYILESDNFTGPWKLVVYMENFGVQGYFVNIPSKFISKDGRTAWLFYSANFTNDFLGTNWQAYPPGGRYAMCLQEIKLMD